jgi:phytoene synthase
MVNNRFIDAGQAAAERDLILTYAPASRRAGLAALLALDDTLAAILRTTRDPMVGQMRLTWWHGALTALDTAPAPAEPVLAMLARDVVPLVSGAALAGIGEGWEELLDPDPLDDGRLQAFAARRGGRLFAAAGAVLGANARDPIELAGRGWALADLAGHVRDEPTARRAQAMAQPSLTAAMAVRWSRPVRPLGALAHLARMDPDAGATRVARLMWHRLTGR